MLVGLGDFFPRGGGCGGRAPLRDLHIHPYEVFPLTKMK